MKYSSPSTDDLMAFKNDLAYTSSQMADLAGLAAGNQWRKYTGGQQSRKMSMQMLFFMAAQLELSEEQLDKVFKRMIDIGAFIE